MRWSLLAAVLVLAIIVSDFFGFCQRASTQIQPDNPRADAIIALTGGSGIRIQEAVKLLEDGAAPRLLISGVNPNVTAEELSVLAGGSPETYECCIEFGYAAQTTVGNAEESAQWALNNQVETVILVTSDYHIPRSLILLGQTMPEIDLTPYPVRTRIDPSKPLENLRSFRGLLWEWTKWRITNLRWGGS
ncbi:MAG: YdcF family protein [Pseudomonadota bacterium]